MQKINNALNLFYTDVVNKKYFGISEEDCRTIFNALDNAGLLEEQHLNAILENSAPCRVLWSLSSLHDADLLNQANFNAVVQYEDSELLCEVLEILALVGLLSGNEAQANFDAVINHQNSSALINAILTVHAQVGLSRDKFKTLVACQDMDAVNDAIETSLETFVLFRDDAPQSHPIWFDLVTKVDQEQILDYINQNQTTHTAGSCRDQPNFFKRKRDDEDEAPQDQDQPSKLSKPS